MLPDDPSIPQAEISTPDELLANAERFYRSNDPNMMRAAVLEAMAALETFVHRKVFSALEAKLDPLLVRWLEEKTRMDFDSRLKVLAPVATGRLVDTRDVLWRDYQASRHIRNRITHAGARVSQDRARFVIDTVYQWLSFLGSSVELQVALIGLQRYFASRPQLDVRNEKDAVGLIIRYFSKTRVADIQHQPLFATEKMPRPDVILRFGAYSVIIEVKFARGQLIDSVIRSAIHELRNNIDIFEATIGAVVVFINGEVDPLYEQIQVLEEGKLYILVIRI